MIEESPYRAPHQVENCGALPLTPLPELWLGEGAEWGHAPEPQVGHCWLNSVAPTRWRASGPCRTLRLLTWSGHRGCWAASRQC